MHRRSLAVVGAVAVLMVVATGSAFASSTSESEPRPGLALFEGKLIDLSSGWGEATACVVFDADRLAECFRDTASLHARETALGTDVSILASCSTPLRLFANTGYGGRARHLHARHVAQPVDLGVRQPAVVVSGRCVQHTLGRERQRRGELVPRQYERWSPGVVDALGLGQPRLLGLPPIGGEGRWTHDRLSERPWVVDRGRSRRRYR